MCGIAGFSLSPQANVNAKKLAKAMLLDIESRGRDATGFAYIDATGAFQVHKDDSTASRFVQRRLCLDKSATSVIMHTRFATQGRPEYMENNHPIATGAVVGVHNGHVSNDYELFAEMAKLNEGHNPRIGQVDSEAIFAALNFYDKAAPTAVLEAVGGGAAVAWLSTSDEKPGTLHLARLNSSPMVIAETACGSVLFASTQSAVMAGANACYMVVEKIRHIAEGSYITVLDGEYQEVSHFQPLKYVAKSYYSTTTSFTKTTDKRSTTSQRYAWETDYNDEEYDYIRTPKDEEAAKIREYQKWWRDNLKAVEEHAKDFDSALASDDAREVAAEQARQGRFDKFLVAPRINSYLVSNAQYVFTAPTEMEYLADPHNVEREYAIERWCNGCMTNEVDKTKIALDMKAHVRPGYAVQTVIDGQTRKGVLVALASSFPDGQYIIRAYVPHMRRPMGHEAVVVSRNYWEFDVVNSTHANLRASVLSEKETVNA